MKSTKRFYLLSFLLGCIVGGVIIGLQETFINPLFAQGNTLSIGQLDPEYTKYMNMFLSAYNIIKEQFYDEKQTTPKILFYGAIKGMLENTGDPYTTFMDPQITKEFNIDIGGTFGGLGIHIGDREGQLTVIAPIEDTPAWKAGLKPNDKILEIDGKSTAGITSSEAVNILRGKPGTKVTLTIGRKGIEPFKVTITRAVIKVPTVKSAYIDQKQKRYGYIRLIEFSMPTAFDFKTSLEQMMKSNVSGLIIDLRNNPGGLLTAVAECANYFISNGLLVYVRGRNNQLAEDYRATPQKFLVPTKIPVVVLINEGSASASEIFAGAMQDTRRGIIVGTKSFGKGSVQQTYPFPEDGSQIKFTVAKYFTPAGRTIDKVGVQPDVEEKYWLETLSDIEKNALVKLQSTNFIKEFLNKNPSYTKADVAQFQTNLMKTGLPVPLLALEYLLYSEKIQEEIPPVYTLEYDNQLQKALEVLDNYSKYQKPIQYYQQAK
ncbi:S41 family peptidase [Thermospira aquatica]|uniref:S41 family peptidase n=1 Tax=Thermospira aquatica TaxID=2828656 RepID=A0AAX3BCP8_9SPIR|nr:S41 family peptidase [Thermospira aquatica]URA09930.1 S41 family peptidase [Thermospira aquatica]